jgi:hypothetical protein
VRLVSGPGCGLLSGLAAETPGDDNSTEANGAPENVKLAQHSPLVAAPCAGGRIQGGKLRGSSRDVTHRTW